MSEDWQTPGIDAGRCERCGGEIKSTGTFEDALAFVAQIVFSTLADRYEAYGPDNILAFGEQGLVIRATDKLARLKRRAFDSDSPPRPDDWIDLAGYALIALMLRTGVWGKPLRRGMKT